MKGKSYGYGSYRGRSGGSAALKAVIVILAVLLVLAVAGFLLAERYMVYSDDGEFRLELPFLTQREEPAPSVSAPPLVTPTVTPDQTPAPTPVQSSVPTPDPTPTPAPVPERPVTILPVSLPLSGLYDGSAKEMVTEGGGTAALFEMKPATGMLGWVSDQELAIKARVSMDDPDYNESVRAAAREDGVYRIAKISCFKDQELSNADMTMAIYTASGYRWLDSDENRWLSPANPAVQDYLIALCVELADLGFDEILLDHAGYPTMGKLNYIKKDESYDPEKFETVITAFYEKLAEELKETDVRVSVVYDPETVALTGQSEKAMQKLGFAVVTRDENNGLHW